MNNQWIVVVSYYVNVSEVFVSWMRKSVAIREGYTPTPNHFTALVGHLRESSTLEYAKIKYYQRRHCFVLCKLDNYMPISASGKKK